MARMVQDDDSRKLTQINTLYNHVEQKSILFYSKWTITLMFNVKHQRTTPGVSPQPQTGIQYSGKGKGELVIATNTLQQRGIFFFAYPTAGAGRVRTLLNGPTVSV